MFKGLPYMPETLGNKPIEQEPLVTEIESAPEAGGVEVQPEKLLAEQLEADAEEAPTPEEVKAEEERAKSEEYLAIEAILEEELEDIFADNIPEEQQPEFKKSGEKLVEDIIAILQDGQLSNNKTRVRTYTLIYKWLSTIPVVAKFWLGQEAKTKTDKILREFRKI